MDGNRVYYRAEADNPIFGDLRGLLLRTAGLKDVLVECLAGFRSRIDAAFVYGSVARGDESAASDVNLMVIGNVGLSELAPALKNAEARLLRPVSPSVYRAEEVAEKLRAGHHFLGTVMGGAKLFIVGGEDDLEAALGRAQRPAARHEPGASSMICGPSSIATSTTPAWPASRPTDPSPRPTNVNGPESLRGY